MVYIDNRIKKTYIDNTKNYGYMASKFIPKNTLIIKEKPAFQLDNNNIYSDMFQLIYNILTSDDKDKIKQFKSLSPLRINNFRELSKKIKQEFIRLSTLKNKNAWIIYPYLKNIPFDDLVLYCAKYIRNAFEFDNKPYILLNGCIFNHSCSPNVRFYKKDEYIYFVTNKDINKNEELCDNYIDIKLNKDKRQRQLLYRYGFDCLCDRCVK